MPQLDPGTLRAATGLGNLAIRGAREVRGWWNRNQRRRPNPQYFYIERRLRKLENRRGEWKTKISSAVTANSTSTPAITCLTYIAQGSTSSTREGDIIYLQSVSYKCMVRNSGSATQAISVRIIIFFDTQNNGTKPSASDVLTSVTQFRSIVTHRNTTSKGRYQIIFDKVIQVGPQFSTNENNGWTQYYKRFKGRKIYFKGTGDTESDMAKGTLWLLQVSDKNTEHYPTVTWEANLKYTDM